MAVYTNLTNEHKEDIRTLYNLGKDADFIEIPEGILNTNYLIKDRDKKYVFRLLEGRRNIDEELKELEFLNFLNKNDISCPRVSVNNLGKNHIFIQEKMGCLFDFIHGKKVNKIDSEVLRKIGSTLGRLHNLSQGRSIERTRKIDLDFFYDKISKIDLKTVLKKDHDLIMERYKEIKEVDFSSLPKGIVHNDIFPDNVFMGEKLSLIDFNDCMNAPFIIDLAIVINFWIKIKEFSKDKEKKFIKIFLEAYEGERKLLPEEKKLLKKMVLKMALTFIFLRINKSYVEDNRGKNMEVKTYKELLFLLEEETDEIY
ncbi:MULTISPECIES: homoserine kinase [Psychrilyobacter]|uniref:Homoserine kinase n=1 Tax=Psychrilyobacter piezotolerans TaxID=2293438 RepID=A0ABX9KHW4_9FUSO|nr:MULTISPECIES: homoserine kinase [Psychrilyobacter]MCS5420657.1 homoserine kinase [Psychrilyobacter sp. S5]NDI77831.1 homoserine kinase [Psychrilyobacter piezotolerans]RDE62315.1 homoserine kinase [Psychrilyobacter sp. S5]REI41413.1 homoserine kinase [Psychrilyobacter piezotolerans]